ncbi:MAG TPA: hypothetical protein VGF21_09030 [Thermoleophilaceae bacterium]
MRGPCALLAAAVVAAGCGSSAGHPSGDGLGPMRAVRAYVDAVNHRDGGRLCSLVASGGFRRLPLERRSAGCERSLDASIGQPGRHGEPAWRGARLLIVGEPRYAGGFARLTISLRSVLAGAGPVPPEQDVVYVEHRSGRWRVAKASALLYRAVGVGDVPLDALRPPRAG